MTTESIPRIKKFACLFSRKSRSLSSFPFSSLTLINMISVIYGPFHRTNSGEDSVLLQYTCKHLKKTLLLSFVYILREIRDMCLKSIVNLVKSLCVSIALGIIKMLQFLLSIKAARQPQIHLHNNQLSMIESRNKKKVMELPSIIQHKERGNRFTLLS